MKKLFRTGSYGLMVTLKELKKLKVLPDNRGEEKACKIKHVENIVNSYVNGVYDYHFDVKINQLGYILDGTHRYLAALRLIEMGYKITLLYIVTNNESLATDNLVILDRVQVAMNNAKASKAWTNMDFYRKALRNPKNYPLATILADECMFINNKAKDFTRGGAKINWIGGLLIEDANTLSGRGGFFTNLDVFRDENLIKKVRTNRYKIDRQHVIDLLIILSKKSVKRPIEIVSYIMGRYWNEKKFNIEAAKVIISNNVPKGFDAGTGVEKLMSKILK